MLPALLSIAHIWIAALWLGGTWFSLISLHRRGPRLFTDEAEFERVIAGLTRGNRWLLLAAASGLALTGGLMWALVEADAALWSTLIAAKLALLLGNVAIVAWVSWIIWPRRLFALPAELPAIRRRQSQLRVATVVFLAANIALGVAAHALRSAP